MTRRKMTEMVYKEEVWSMGLIDVLSLPGLIPLNSSIMTLYSLKKYSKTMQIFVIGSPMLAVNTDSWHLRRQQSALRT